MGANLRLPKITAADSEGKLIQIQSFLYQLTEQLNYALGSIETGIGNDVRILKESADKKDSEPLSPEAAKNNFNAIKSLIIKSADIVNSYYEEVNRRLQGIYVAESVFGTYSEKTDHYIQESSKEINRVLTNVQTIKSDLKEIGTSVRESKGHIKAGTLFYNTDGDPVFGVEIGQTNTVYGVEEFNKFARFTSDRLSFYNEVEKEVAYISDSKLYINTAEILGDADVHGNLSVGGLFYLPGFLIDTSDGLVIMPRA